MKKITKKTKGQGFLNQGNEVMLYGIISETMNSSVQFADFLSSTDSSQELVVRINSAGGDVNEGIAIYSLLKSFGGKVTVKVDGIAGSIASVIAMAGDVVEMSRNAVMMIHNPEIDGASGGANDMRKFAEILDTIKESIKESYLARSLKITPEQLDDFMENETYFTAKEALEYGFIDSITGEVKENKEIKEQVTALAKISRVMNMLEEEQPETPPADPKTQEQLPEETTELAERIAKLESEMKRMQEELLEIKKVPEDTEETPNEKMKNFFSAIVK